MLRDGQRNKTMSTKHIWLENCKNNALQTLSCLCRNIVCIIHLYIHLGQIQFTLMEVSSTVKANSSYRQVCGGGISLFIWRLGKRFPQLRPLLKEKQCQLKEKN